MTRFQSDWTYKVSRKLSTVLSVFSSNWSLNNKFVVMEVTACSRHYTASTAPEVGSEDTNKALVRELLQIHEHSCKEGITVTAKNSMIRIRADIIHFQNRLTTFLSPRLFIISTSGRIGPMGSWIETGVSQTTCTKALRLMCNWALRCDMLLSLH